MLRELQTVLNKNTPSNFKASVNMITGMGVMKDLTNNTLIFPTADTGVNIFLVNKERIPTGINTARFEMSDYDPNFVNITANEFVKVINPLNGERYGTDQFTGTVPTPGDYIVVDTNGKWKAAGTGASSIFVFAGTYVDVNATLWIIEVKQISRS